MSALTERVNKIAEKNSERFLEFFRYLHRHPETSTKEYGTSSYISGILKDLGIEIIDIGMETGVVGLLRGGKEGPCIALRCDIDALPVTE